MPSTQTVRCRREVERGAERRADARRPAERERGAEQERAPHVAARTQLEAPLAHEEREAVAEHHQQPERRR